MKFSRETLPNLYIGSKSNCKILDGKIYGNRGLYEGSSRDPEFIRLHDISSDYTIQVIGEYNSYQEALTAEREAHIANDVVLSPEYFNRAIALENNWSNPEYATYKHVGTGKIARIKRDHPEVGSTWVGVTKGVILDEEARKRRGSPGTKNPFYGKHHSDETKAIIAAKNSLILKGKMKTDEHKRKLSIAATARWKAYYQRKANREETGI